MEEEIEEKKEIEKKEIEKKEIEKKECKYCKETLESSMFRKNRRKCKNCEKKDGREYRQSEYGKTKAKTWSENNKERHAELQSKWAKNNRERLNTKFNERKKVDPIFKMKVSCKNQLLKCLKKYNNTKKNSTTQYLGCEIDFFVEWLEYCFTDGMTMENHGTFWHLDHVIPVSEFDLEQDKEAYMCFNYTNYMPLPAKENMSKQNKIIKSQLETHLKNLKNFHNEKKIEINIDYIKLIARHLKMTGTSLEF
jgi:hypothetical protein